MENRNEFVKYAQRVLLHILKVHAIVRWLTCTLLGLM